jgi:thioredoxin reductase (NADPH)
VLLAEKYQLEQLSILTNGQNPEFSNELFEQIASTNILIFKSPIQEVLGNLELRQLSGFLLETGEIIDAEMGFVLLGIRPNNQLAFQVNAELDDRGLVITNSDGETSVPNLFVVGDLRSNSTKQIYTAWQQAVESVQLINKRIRETK